ncbi:MAG: YjbQ family protein [Ignavibacteriales bacterium]|nr:YjbQ family protein [Ignavibacteriales bacterium]
MEIITEHLAVSTQGNSDVVDITAQIASFVSKHGLSEGNATVFVSGSTAAVTTSEYEPGLVKDIPDAMERVAPQGLRYHHDDTWHDGNGHSHVRAALMGPSLTVPFSRGELLLGTWQQIVLIDFDTRARKRQLVVQLVGKQ